MSPDIWSEKDKDKMRSAAEAHMSDKGYRMVWSVTIDKYGDDIENWTKANNPTICGIETHEGREVKGDMTDTTYEITVRVPYNFDINEKDRFLITSFRGDTVSWEYELTTPIQYGISATKFGARRLVH